MDGLDKKCTKCDQVKPLNEFHNSSRSKDGKKPSCKECTKKYNISPKVREMSRERNARYRERHRDEIKQRNALWLEENKEHVKEYNRKYYEENKEQILCVNKEYREQHKQEMAEYKAGWYAENAEQVKQKVREWSLTNPLKVKATKLRYRSKKSCAASDITDTELSDILKYFNGECALTGDKYNLTFDHVIPLSVGNVGSVKGNIIPLRHDINSSKNDRNIFEWFSKYKEPLNLDDDKFDKLIEFLAKENHMSVAEYKEYYNLFFNERERYIDEI